MRFALLGMLLLATVACGSTDPIAIAAGDTCFRCGRPIVDVRLAGEVISSQGFALKFRTPKCMAQFLVESQARRPEPPWGVYVTDYPTRRLINASSAAFVLATIDPNTLEQDYLAFSSLEAAGRAARERGKSVVAWPQILHAARALLTE